MGCELASTRPGLVLARHDLVQELLLKDRRQQRGPDDKKPELR
jgi:hypothetical protein